MTDINEKPLQKYLKNLKKELPYSYFNKKNVLKENEISLKSYLFEHPNSTYEDLVSEFGNPKEVVKNSIAMENTEDIMVEMSKKRISRPVFIIGLIGIIVFIIMALKACGEFANVVHTETTIYEYESIENTTASAEDKT